MVHANDLEGKDVENDLVMKLFNDQVYFSGVSNGKAAQLNIFNHDKQFEKIALRTEIP